MMFCPGLRQVQETIGSVCRRLGRDPKSVTLVGVSKYASLDKVRAALQAGLKHLGENRVQEASVKFDQLKSEGFSFVRHMVGHLQTNKVGRALQCFDVIQSVDRPSLVAKLEKAAAGLERRVPVLVQVKTHPDPGKFGVPIEAADALAEAVLRCPHLILDGVMTITPLTHDDNLRRACFQAARRVWEMWRSDYKNEANAPLRYLSMGMSDDYVIALEEGSNMVRIGRALFQPAPTGEDLADHHCSV